MALGGNPVAMFTFVLPGLRAKPLMYKEWRGGRVAEGGGLLNRYTLSRRIEGSNPSLSANTSFAAIRR